VPFILIGAVRIASEPEPLFNLKFSNTPLPFPPIVWLEPIKAILPTPILV